MGSIPAFASGEPLTWVDLESMPDDGRRYELVDGVLLVSPSPRPVHQRVVARLVIALSPVCPPELEVLPAPVDVVLSDRTVFIPDVVVGEREAFTTRALMGPPVLAIEVLSRSTRLVDLELKRAKLEEAGCPHYWIVDPDMPFLRCLALHKGAYIDVAESNGDEEIVLTEPFAVKLSAAQLVSEHPS
ncbi:Uma2 family endonuclease [Lentzea tibetensis]|uniref:Uma2 family endonuclease n=1 Tax=Lentzea tibetensis TaxID=2591470 RepID=A0A563EEZ1_9PSEU|nr:Uma2 family endonuclease [Lentzea tibetensis]TWP43975.1 Uma2 family endonuclease [Lentzea tibetensis]